MFQLRFDLTGFISFSQELSCKIVIITALVIYISFEYIVKRNFTHVLGNNRNIWKYKFHARKVSSP